MVPPVHALLSIETFHRKSMNAWTCFEIFGSIDEFLTSKIMCCRRRAERGLESHIWCGHLPLEVLWIPLEEAMMILSVLQLELSPYCLPLHILLPVHSRHHHLRLYSEWWRSSQLPRGRLERVQSYKEVHRYSLQLCSPECVMCSPCKCWIFDPFSVLNSLLWLISPAHVGWAHAWWPSWIQFSSMGLEDLKVFPGGTTCDITSLHLVGQSDPLIIGVMVSLILNLAFIGHWNSNLILNLLWGDWWQNVKVSEGLLTKDIAGLLILISSPWSCGAHELLFLVTANNMFLAANRIPTRWICWTHNLAKSQSCVQEWSKWC